MPTNNHEHGLEMVDVPGELQRMCEAAHGSFCANHDLRDWSLKITQPQRGAFKIVSTAPIGGTAEQTAMRPGRNFQDHVAHLLESHYSVFQHYVARERLRHSAR